MDIMTWESLACCCTSAKSGQGPISCPWACLELWQTNHVIHEASQRVLRLQGLSQRLVEDECDKWKEKHNSVLRPWYIPYQTCSSVNTMKVHIGGREDVRHLCRLLKTRADDAADITQILERKVSFELDKGAFRTDLGHPVRFFKCVKWRASEQKMHLTHNPDKLLLPSCVCCGKPFPPCQHGFSGHLWLSSVWLF